ncbi:MAG: glycosyl transferase [Naasia sp.]|nr:glycosyl transferase [Naasia sp.]
MLPGAVAPAIRLGPPVVVLVHTFGEFFLGNLAVAAFSVLQGVPPVRAWAAAERVLVMADRELDPAGRSVVGDVGPQTSPRVLASLSSMAIRGQDRILQRILDAVGGMPVNATATSGPTIDPAALNCGANTTLVRTVPHESILSTCSAVVGHAGHSTTMRALLHGVPMVLIPCDTRIDQPLVAASIARAGAGIHLPMRATAGEIRAALDEVLSDSRYRAGAQRIGARLRAQQGAARAADLVLEAAGR